MENEESSERRTFPLILVALVTKKFTLLLEAVELLTDLGKALVESRKGVGALGAGACWL